jgi:hypothetical protein
MLASAATNALIARRMLSVFLLGRSSIRNEHGKLDLDRHRIITRAEYYALLVQ